MMTGVSQQGPLLLFPWLRHFIPGMIGYTSTKVASQNVYDIANNCYKEHLETFDENHMRDFLDVYISKMKETLDETSSFYGLKGIQNLEITFMDLFVAGSETTANTINWTLYYLSANQGKLFSYTSLYLIIKINEKN